MSLKESGNMEVDFAFLADSADAVNGKLYLVGGAIDTIWSNQVPVIYPRLSFAMRILFAPSELGRKHKLEVSIINEDGVRIAAVGGDLDLGPKSPQLPAGWRQAFLGVLHFVNLKFENFGHYSFDITIDNFSLKSIPVRIAQQVTIQGK